MNKEEEFNLIQHLNIFSSIDGDSLKQILSLFQIIELQPDEFLFHRGDNSTDLYILISGRLNAVLQDKDQYKVIGIIEPGETIGELGAISGAPRTLSINAQSHAKLLKISSESFKILCDNYPAILSNIFKIIISRSQKTLHFLSEKKNYSLSIIIAANQQVPVDVFMNKSREIAGSETIVKFISDLDANTAQPSFNEEGKHIVLIARLTDMHLIMHYLPRSNNLYLLIDDHNSGEISQDIIHLFNEQLALPFLKKKLILLHADNVATPEQTIKWLNKGKFALHHHVRLTNTLDYQRLFRFITGRSKCLVLSGGGAKGWAHIGIIKALQESNIIIDAVCGTSIGAVVGACMATSTSYSELASKFSSVTTSSYNLTSWMNLSWPLLSVFSPKTIITNLKSAFSPIQIEDLWTPFFCVTANLSENREEVHSVGPVWRALQASNAVPGVLPPVIINGQLHVDGGVVNNLPVDVMRNICGPEGLIIASKLTPYLADETHYNFPEVLSLKEVIAYKLGLKKFKVPPLINLIYKSLLLGSIVKEQQNETIADILIQPDTEKYGIYSLNKEEEQELLKLGYQEALKKL